MAKWSSDKGEVAIKIAVVGQAGSGKKSIVQAVAAARGQATLRTGFVSGAEVARTDFIWPEPLPDGPFVKVRVFGITGNPFHEAAEQLMLTDADAVVFVVDCDANAISASRDKLIAMMGNATHVGMDWQSTIVVMQYNRAERYPQLKPDDLDQWLGIKEANVARYLTSSNSGENLCVAVNEAARKTIRKLQEEDAHPQSQKASP
ncbi:MAG: Rab family GTPase [Akkermansiaceae bacterium]